MNWVKEAISVFILVGVRQGYLSWAYLNLVLVIVRESCSQAPLGSWGLYICYYEMAPLSPDISGYERELYSSDLCEMELCSF